MGYNNQIKTMKRQKKTIIYVNFSPYENTGGIADYILSHFSTVILFIFNFHRLGKKQERSRIEIYRMGRLVEKCYIFQTVFAPKWALVSLSIRSFIIFLQIVYHTLRYKSKYGPYDIYFSVNAFTVWSGNILKKIGIVKKTIFWVWDYYPPQHPNIMISFIRWIYWQFDKEASKNADKIIFLNKRLEKLHKQIGIVSKKHSYPIVGIGTNYIPLKNKPNKDVHLAFLGTIKKSQGLDFIFDSSKMLQKTFPTIHLDIFGDGPDESYYRQLAKQCLIPTKFYGYIPNCRTVNTLIAKCSVGIATYIPDKENVSYFGDPSKIKAYLSAGLPVITTDVFEFHKIIKDTESGIVITYGDMHGLIKSLRHILQHYSHYQSRAIRLAKQLHYEKIYPSLFTSLK